MHNPHCKRYYGICYPELPEDTEARKLVDHGVNLFLTCRSVKQEAEDIFFRCAQFRTRSCFPSRLRIRNGSRGCSDVAYQYLKQAAIFQSVQKRNKPSNSRKFPLYHDEAIFTGGFESVTMVTLLPIYSIPMRNVRWWNNHYVDGITNVPGKTALFELLKLASLGIFKLSFYLDLRQWPGNTKTANQRVR